MNVTCDIPNLWEAETKTHILSVRKHDDGWVFLEYDRAEDRYLPLRFSTREEAIDWITKYGAYDAFDDEDEDEVL
jgi:hypothetical protein